MIFTNDVDNVTKELANSFLAKRYSTTVSGDLNTIDSYSRIDLSATTSANTTVFAEIKGRGNTNKIGRGAVFSSTYNDVLLSADKVHFANSISADEKRALFFYDDMVMFSFDITKPDRYDVRMVPQTSTFERTNKVARQCAFFLPKDAEIYVYNEKGDFKRLSYEEWKAYTKKFNAKDAEDKKNADGSAELKYKLQMEIINNIKKRER